ncbi:phosphotransferase enzyme family protein [Actinomadura atramentaria]|uniref:phosphotransferase enzyme family protein n=1 Tax=Actinomadura atramentaria TaxID=1990 RepID=UPI00146BED90|nr:phosphotransferase [Actinomadura atramentaria]
MAVVGDVRDPRRWVLRNHHRDPRLDRVRFLADFADDARRVGVPFAPVLRDLDGHGAVAVGGQVWTATGFVAGRSCSAEPSDLSAAGTALAALHRHALTGDIRPVPGDLAWNAWLDFPDSMWAAVTDLTGIADRPVLARYRPHVAALGEYLANRPVDRDRLPEAWTHGDFHGGNLLVHGPRMAAIVDLDGVDRRPRIWDVAYACLMLGRHGPGDYRLRPDALATLLAAYRNMAAPLGLAELHALWPCMVASQLPDPRHLHALRRAGRPIMQALHRPLAALAVLTDPARAELLNGLLGELLNAATARHADRIEGRTA